MIIKELTLTDFAALHSPSLLKLKDGLTVLQGPNEAGKSSLINAIRIALFYKPSQDNPEIRSAIQRYGKGSRYIIEMQYELDGEEYQLIKDFERKTAELYVPPYGDRKTNADQIQELLLNAVGLPQEDYLRTALIKQRDLAFERTEDLVQRLQKILVGADVEITSIQGSLEEAGKQLLRKIYDRRGGPGIVLNCLKELNELKRKYSELKKSIESTVTRRKSREDLKKKLDLIELGGDGKLSIKELNEKLQKAKAMRTYVEQRKKANNALDWIEKAEKSHQTLRETDKSLRELQETKLPAAQKEFNSAKQQHEAKENFHKAKEEFEKAKENLKKAQKIQRTIEEFKDETAKNQKVLTRMTKATESNLDEARKTQQNLEVGQASIRSLSARILLESLKKDLTVKTSVDGKVPIEQTFNVGDIREHDVNQSFEAEIPEVMRFSVKLPDIKELEMFREQVKTSREKLSSILMKFKVESVEALGKSVKERQVIEDKLKELNNKRSAQITTFKELFGDRASLAELEQIVKLKDRTVKEAQKILKKFKGKPPDSNAIKALEKKIDNLKTQLTEVKTERAEHNANLVNSLKQIELTDFNKKVLDQKSKDARKLLLTAEDGIDELGENVELSEEVEDLEKKTKHLEGEKADLREKIARLEGPDEENLPGEEALNEPIEEAIQVYERVHEHRRMEAVIERALAILSEAQAALIPAAERRIADRVAVYMAKLSNGRYDTVIWKGFDTLDLRLSGDGLPMEGLPLDSPFLSGGTRDQFYFSARLALLDFLAGDRRPPLLLDDPFSEFDPERRGRAISILQELCVDRNRQIFLFTCQDYYKTLVERVIEVDLVKSRAG